MLKFTETDLHIQFKIETGDYFQYIPGNLPRDHSGIGYHSTKRYRSIYAEWLEQKLIKKLNQNNN